MKNYTFIFGMALAFLLLVWIQTDRPITAAAAAPDKWALWQNGPQLRGANIHQRRSYLDADGPDISAIGPVIPPYTQADFDDLAEMGANYVNISHPGLFTEEPPYVVDTDIQDNLDQLLAKIAQADMFAVISFRTGPGRNEFVFLEEESAGWLGYSKDINFLWTDQAAQDAWVTMWRYTAERYRDNPIVAGYDLMVEPHPNALLNIWDPDDFYPAYANTLYDWNQFYPDISAAIREVDTQTPLLIGGMSYGAVSWLPYLQPTGDSRTVYIAHTYEPFAYTHQYPPLTRTYPGTFDADYDNVAETVNKDWLDSYLAPVDTFKTTHNVPVAINEYGVMRWQPGAAQYMADMMDLLEGRGLNHAWWLWPPSDDRFADYVNDFNVRFGPNPANKDEVTASALLTALLDAAGNLYISDVGNNRILEYDTPLTTDTTADRVFGQDNNFNSDTPNNGGLSTTSLDGPLGLTLDTQGNLYVADGDNNRLLVFNAPPVSLLNSNLIENGNAEANPGSNDGSTFTPASWRVTQGNFTAVQYGASGGFPGSGDPGPTNRGDNFFGGGLGSDTTFAEQVIDVSDLAAQIDSGEITYETAGYFGGFADQPDTAAMEINFKDENGGLIIQQRLGDPTPADRGNQTGLLLYNAEDTVPTGTRQVQIILQMQRLGGFNFNDGYADNLSLVLSGAEVQVYLPLVVK